MVSNSCQLEAQSLPIERAPHICRFSQTARPVYRDVLVTFKPLTLL